MEVIGILNTRRADYEPGNFLGSSQWETGETWENYQLKELNNGRLAMFASIGMLVGSYITGKVALTLTLALALTLTLTLTLTFTLTLTLTLTLKGPDRGLLLRADGRLLSGPALRTGSCGQSTQRVALPSR